MKDGKEYMIQTQRKAYMIHTSLRERRTFKELKTLRSGRPSESQDEA